MYLIKKRERENLHLIKDKKLIHIQPEIEVEGVEVIEVEIEGEVQALEEMIVEAKEVLILEELTEVFQEDLVKEVETLVEELIEAILEDFQEVMIEVAAQEDSTPEEVQGVLAKEGAVVTVEVAEVEVEDDDGYITFN